MGDRIDPVAGLLARKGEARPAMRADNDNDRTTPAAPGLPVIVAAAIELAGGRPASMTLRLDPARHMRLRLACAIGGRSAQAVMAEALDAHLKTIPGIERLVAAAMAEGGEQTASGRGKDR
ncbi:hypothetical protein [Sphingomonas solaris]|uniref:hypothetical protein n=1 Tax=Alterirhizorhabdus solaris TaxID=2529389 RepID=UPI00193A0647|nr:hypothetical protein [Sphingomonas solaris]